MRMKLEGSMPRPGGSHPGNSALDGAIRATDPLRWAIDETNLRKHRRIPRLPNVPYRPVKLLDNLIGLGIGRNPYLRFVNFGFELAMRMDWNDPWAQATPGPMGWTLANVPQDWISCYNPSMPWSGPQGTGWSTWAGCPGGDCEPGAIHVLHGQSDGPPDPILIADTRTCSGTQGNRRRSVIIGPASGVVATRFATKLKICPPTRCWWPEEAPTHIDLREQIKLPRPLPQGIPPPASITETDSAPDPYNPPFRPPHKEPSIDYEIIPNARSRPKPEPGEHDNRPPNVGEREKKWKGPKDERSLAAFIAALYDATTEASEIVDIMYENLGTKCPGAMSMSAKAYCVWSNLSTLDIDKTYLDILNNHYEDKIYGRVFGILGKHTPYGSMLPGSGPYRDPGRIRQLSQRT